MSNANLWNDGTLLRSGSAGFFFVFQPIGSF